MADPMTVLGIMGAIGGILNVSVRAIGGLRQLQSSYTGATETLRQIVDNCSMLQTVVTQLNSWIKSMPEEEIAELPLEALEKSLRNFQPKMQGLDNQVKKLLAGAGPTDSVGWLQRVKFMWNEDEMAQYLSEIRSQAEALNLLVGATNLILSQNNYNRQMRVILNIKDLQNSHQRSREATQERFLQFQEAYSTHYSWNPDNHSASLHSTDSNRVSTFSDDLQGLIFSEQPHPRSDYEHITATQGRIPCNGLNQLAFRHGDISSHQQESVLQSTPATEELLIDLSVDLNHRSAIRQQTSVNTPLFQQRPASLETFSTVGPSTNPFRRNSSICPPISASNQPTNLLPSQNGFSATTYVRALADIFLPGTGTIQCCKGDIIIVHKLVNAQWLIGSTRGQIGNFPITALEKLQGSGWEETGASKISQCRALYDFIGKELDELAFLKGDVIEVLETKLGSWWKGYLRGQVGIFPANYVESAVSSHTGISTQPTITVSPQPTPIQLPGKFVVKLSTSEQEKLSPEAQSALISISEDKIDIESRIGDDKCTPFLIAARCGSIDTVNNLRNFFKPDESARDIYQRTALHLAAMSGNVVLVQMLLPVERNAAHAEADKVDVDNASTLHYASRYGNLAVVAFLVEHYGTLAGKKLANKSKSRNYTPFLEAVAHGHLEVIQLLVSYGTQIDARDIQDRNALHIAAGLGWLKVTEYLLGLKMIANARDRWGNTALHLAADSGSLGHIQCLIKAGADVNSKNHDKQTPLHKASSRGSINIVMQLLQKGAKKDQRAIDGTMAADRACQNGHLGVLKLLNPKINNELMYHACVRNQISTLEWLLTSHIPDLNTPICSPSASHKSLKPTLLHCVAQTSHVAIAAALVSRGAKVCQPDKELNTPLHWAARSGRLDMVKFLLEKSANPDAINRLKQKPGMLACQELKDVDSGQDVVNLMDEIRRLLISRLKGY